MSSYSNTCKLIQNSKYNSLFSTMNDTYISYHRVIGVEKSINYLYFLRESCVILLIALQSLLSASVNAQKVNAHPYPAHLTRCASEKVDKTYNIYFTEKRSHSEIV